MGASTRDDVETEFFARGLEILQSQTYERPHGIRWDHIQECGSLSSAYRITTREIDGVRSPPA